MRDTVEVNLVGSMAVTKHAVARFAENGGGAIVLLTGGGAGDGLPNYSVYAASKLAIARFVECVAVETADIGVRINALAPGMIPTKIHDATLAAGPELAGPAYYERTVGMLEAEDSSGLLGNVSTAVGLLLRVGDALPTGRFFAAQHDPAEVLTAARLRPDDFRLRRTKGQDS
jgi:3-oxoacyl-[acyl-carrier protein] reductase